MIVILGHIELSMYLPKSFISFGGEVYLSLCLSTKSTTEFLLLPAITEGHVLTMYCKLAGV